MQQIRETTGGACAPIYCWSRKGVGSMEHSEALKQMAAERYLLDELTPELREEFEEHMFDCQECAFDIRAGAAFVDEARTQLPELAWSSPALRAPAAGKAGAKRSKWNFWWQPAFAAPVFAGLLGVIAFQNFATIPTLRTEATEPRLVPWVSLHAGTRGSAHTKVSADRHQGAVLLIDLPQDSAYASYEFNLYDPGSKQFWTHVVTASQESGPEGGTYSLLIPGAGLQEGSYTLAVVGITAQSGRTEVDRRVLDIHFDE
jgi:hypothetical protein